MRQTVTRAVTDVSKLSLTPAETLPCRQRRHCRAVSGDGTVPSEGTDRGDIGNGAETRCQRRRETMSAETGLGP